MSFDDNFRKVVPYVPGEQPQNMDVIKLNTNENPYPPAPGVIALAKELTYDPLRLYPDYKATELVTELARSYKVSEDCIFVGVGSDDVLSMVFLTCFNSGKPVFFPDITYSFYEVWADVYRIPYEKKPLDENFRIKASDYYGENGGVVIANPNAPTGIAENIDFIRDILDHNRESVVVVDEAYIDFGGESAASLLSEYDNLVVVETFSKSRSLAGLRIGFAFASPKIIKAINDVKYSINSYTLNMPSIKLGAEAVRNGEYYRDITQKVIFVREEFSKELSKRDFEILPSSTNFVFAKHKTTSGSFIFEELKKRGIFVRHFKGERIKEYLRITIGTREQMEKLLEALDEIL